MRRYLPVIQREEIVIPGALTAVSDPASKQRNCVVPVRKLWKSAKSICPRVKGCPVALTSLYRISRPARSVWFPRSSESESPTVVTDGLAGAMLVGVPTITPPPAGAIRISGKPGSWLAFALAMPIWESVTGSWGIVLLLLNAYPSRSSFARAGLKK